MRSKCLRMLISDFNDVNSLYTMLKKKVDFNGVEGVAQVCNDQENEVELVLSGAKDTIDEIVDVIDEVVMKEDMSVSVEPFLKEEDFRGVFRFIQKT